MGPESTRTSDGDGTADAERLGAAIVEELRVVIVGGVLFGAVVAGVGSRLAMLLLRVTSPDHVVGIQSDDDFTIGEFTIGGTYNLLVLGAFVGVIGVGIYRLVRPWLIGPTWFRRLTTAAASGAVVGSMLVHADGVDFRLLKPTWLAIGLFVALPALFGGLIGPVVDRVERPDSATRVGRRRWGLVIAAIVAFPPIILILPFAAASITLFFLLRESERVQALRATVPYGLVVRTAWLGIAVLGLQALLTDIAEVARVV